MLRPEYLASVADPVVEIYSKVEQDIAEDIARFIIKNGYSTDSAKYQANKAQELGLFRKDVNQILSQASTKAKCEISKIMSEAGTRSLAFDDAIYRAAGLAPIALSKSPVLAALLLQGMDTTLGLIGNFTKTTAQVSTVAFTSILDSAYIQILNGTLDPNTAIKRAIKEIATMGIDKITYPSGASSSIEAAVRRAVTTGVNQSIGRLSLARAEEMGCELVETSSHAGARPSHAEWQGRVFCIKGHHKKYGDFYRETGYGTGEGLCGWNCYHSFYPFFEGLSTHSFSRDPSKDAGRNNDEDYMLQQKQRYYERQVRAAKKECSIYKAAMEAATSDDLRNELYEEFQRASLKLKKRRTILRRFLEETGRTRMNDREWIGG